MKIQCRTLFDITATGVTGHIKPSRMPYKDQAGNMISNNNDWNRSRNQQRNWETITQLISLRTQISSLSEPQRHNNQWVFEFEVDIEGLFAQDQDPLGVLKADCESVPMLTGLDEFQDCGTVLMIDKNLWFDLML